MLATTTACAQHEQRKPGRHNDLTNFCHSRFHQLPGGKRRDRQPLNGLTSLTWALVSHFVQWCSGALMRDRPPTEIQLDGPREKGSMARTSSDGSTLCLGRA